jgi:hypothetical protein
MMSETLTILAVNGPLSTPRNGNQAFTVVVTVACYAAVIAAFVLAIKRARDGDRLGLGCLIGALIVSFGEPIYDSAYQLTFFSQGMTIWSPFTIAQPLWVPAGYAVAYGMSGWWIAARAARGEVTAAVLTRMTLVIFVGCVAFELVNYHGGVNEYWGHSITFLGHPFWIDVFNAVFVAVAGMTIAALQSVARTMSFASDVWLTIVVYVVGFAGVQYGTGFLALDVLHSPHARGGWMWVAIIVSTGTAIALLWTAINLTLRLQSRPALASTRGLPDQVDGLSG